MWRADFGRPALRPASLYTRWSGLRPRLTFKSTVRKSRRQIIRTAAAVAALAALSAFVPGVPLTGLLLLPLALGRARTQDERLAIALGFELAMAIQTVPLLLGYGYSVFAVIPAIIAVIVLHVGLMMVLPPAVAMIALIFSPLFWGHPIFAALEVTPLRGAGAVAFGGLLVMLLSVRRWQGVGLSLYAACAALRLFSHAALALPVVRGLDTAFTARSLLPVSDWARVAQKIESLPHRYGRPIALPESTIQSDWARGERYFVGVAAMTGRTLLIGEARPTGQSIVAIRVDGAQVRTVYHQRWPILGVDWRPWRDITATPQWSNGVATIEGGDQRDDRVGFLICYEAYLALPWLQTIAAEPDSIVVIANDRWSRGTLYPIAGAKIRAAAGWAIGSSVAAARNR